MTATKKLFIAAMVLAAGFGVARLMGRPDTPWLTSRASDPSFDVNKQAAVAAPAVGASSTKPIANGARLVPDFSAENPYKFPAGSRETIPARHDKTNRTGAAVSPPPLATDTGYQLLHKSFEPRAQLRDEAPRPLDLDSRGATAVYAPQKQTTQGVDIPPASAARSAAADWRASGLTPAEFVQTTSAPATITASYCSPANTATNDAAVAPPPWPKPGDASGPRTHVIVDGDSLERLAGRYLDDSRRAHEIYEANRELLASPDLLPIGVEIVIPMPKRQSAMNESWPQSSLTSNSSLREAANDGSVRGRPATSAVHVLPRAQLLPPVQVD